MGKNSYQILGADSMTIKEETTLLVHSLAQMDPHDDQAITFFLTENLKRFKMIIENHTQGPLDDPVNPERKIDRTIDPKNIFLTILLLQQNDLFEHLSGKFAQFIDQKWLFSLEVMTQLIPLDHSAAQLQSALQGISMTQFLTSLSISDLPEDYEQDVVSIKLLLQKLFNSYKDKLDYLTDFILLLPN